MKETLEPAEDATSFQLSGTSPLVMAFQEASLEAFESVGIYKFLL